MLLLSIFVQNVKSLWALLEGLCSFATALDCGKRDTDNIHLCSHPLTLDFSFPLIHSLKIGHLLRKIFDTPTFTSRSPRMKSVWESVPSLQHRSVFCFVFKGCLFPGEKHPFLPERQQADACKHRSHSRFHLSSLLFPQFSE